MHQYLSSLREADTQFQKLQAGISEFGEITATFLEPFTTASTLCSESLKMQMKWGHLKKNIPANCALGKKKKMPLARRAILKSMKLSNAGWCFILKDNVRWASPSWVQKYLRKRVKITLFRRLISFMKKKMCSCCHFWFDEWRVKQEIILNVHCWKLPRWGLGKNPESSHPTPSS